MIISKNGPIPHRVVENLTDNYKEHKKKRLDMDMKPDNSGQKRDTTSVWFDYEFCKILMEDLKRKHIKGLRIYFGAYDKNNGDNDKKNKLTVILVTTTGSETESEEAVDDITPEDSNDKSKLMEYNDGSLCPPKCNPPLTQS